MVREVLRTCKGCGSKRAKVDLERYVLRDGIPVKDRLAIMSGRGAYCCKNAKCTHRFLWNQKRWRRAFRYKV